MSNYTNKVEDGFELMWDIVDCLNKIFPTKWDEIEHIMCDEKCWRKEYILKHWPEHGEESGVRKTP